MLKVNISVSSSYSCNICLCQLIRNFQPKACEQHNWGSREINPFCLHFFLSKAVYSHTSLFHLPQIKTILLKSEMCEGILLIRIPYLIAHTVSVLQRQHSAHFSNSLTSALNPAFICSPISHIIANSCSRAASYPHLNATCKYYLANLNMQDVSSAIHFVLIYFPILCNRKLLQLPSLCSLSTIFTGFFLCTLHNWSLKDNVCNITVLLPLAFSTPFCYLKYCFSIMLPTSKHLQSHSP